MTEKSVEQDRLISASEDELIALRKCEREDCEYRIPNGVKDL